MKANNFSGLKLRGKVTSLDVLELVTCSFRYGAWTQHSEHAYRHKDWLSSIITYLNLQILIAPGLSQIWVRYVALPSHNSVYRDDGFRKPKQPPEVQ